MLIALITLTSLYFMDGALTFGLPECKTEQASCLSC